ncbi:ABC transporter substrate-binding protein [Paenibacillus rhizophilus]|uniref:ABC transporter substrate-binding protein n=2 Tax=Paenibacillus rhizophilus TaxID=1850366 RepID=A0A3N9PCT5_9BACL|nr:ABC transporter substrate-binding protein [Paenibacillus rhizophilus]
MGNMRMRTKPARPIMLRALLLLAAVSTLLAGCGKDADTAEAGSSVKGPDIIRLPTPTNLTGISNYYVAEELGYVKEAGLQFDYVGAVESGQLVASVVAGKIDVGGAHINRTIAGISAGAKIKAVVAQTETTEEIPHMSFVTTKDSPIKSAADIVGKKVGIPAFGGCNEYTPYAYLLKNGIADPKGKFEIVTAPEFKLEQALLQGEVDLIGLHENPSTIIKRGNLKVVFTDYDIWKSIGGATPLYFSNKFIKEKPDVVRRFVDVISKTNDFVNANPEKAIEITAKRGDMDPAKIRANHYAAHGEISPESVQVWIDLLSQFNEIKKDVKPEDIFTNEFNDTLK